MPGRAGSTDAGDLGFKSLELDCVDIVDKMEVVRLRCLCLDPEG